MRPWTLSLLLVAALGADAKVMRDVDFVEVFLSGDGCRGAPETIYVAFNGTDEPNGITTKDGQRWIGPPTKAVSVDLDTVTAYVRFNNGSGEVRTDYQRPQKYARRTLTFKFTVCKKDGVSDLKVATTVDAKDPVSVSYTREWPGSRTGPNTIWNIPDGNDIIYAVWFSGETLSLQLAWSDKARNVPALLVTSLNGWGEPVFVISPRDGGNFVLNPRLWNGHPPKQLSPADILRAMDVQSVVGRKNGDVRWNGYSRGIEESELQKARLQTLVLTPQ